MNVLILGSGIYLVMGCFLMRTENMISAVLLRAVPGVIGFGLMISGAKHWG